MNLDNKKPGRKPLYVYYIIAAVIIILLNVLLLPAIEGRKVQTTDYSTFLTGVEKDYVKTVEIQDDYIYYVAESDGQEGYFRTVKMNDPDLVDRLHDANVKFGAAAPQQTSIWISRDRRICTADCHLYPSWKVAQQEDDEFHGRRSRWGNVIWKE